MAKTEYFPVIDELGNVIGKTTRAEAHNGSRILHPVVHNHIFDPQGKILLQKRSMNKDIQPGKWDTAVGGHVDYGEEIEEAMLRETREELGITGFLFKKIATYIYDSDREREQVNVFVTHNFNGTLTIDPIEVDEARFWSISEVDEAIGKGIFTPNFEEEFMKLRNKLLQQCD